MTRHDSGLSPPLFALVLAGLLATGSTPATGLGGDSQTTPGAEGDPGLVPTGVEARPLPENLEGGGRFGFRIALNENGTRLAVGAPSEDAGGAVHAGAAYLLERASPTADWHLVARLIAPEPEDSFFGGSIALGEESLAVGDPIASLSNGETGGKAYVYDLDEIRNGSATPRVLRPPGHTGGGFASELELADDRLVVGDSGTGNLHLYDLGRGSPRLAATFGPGGIQPGKGLGRDHTIALDGDVLAAGAIGHSKDQPGAAGGVFLYRYDPAEDAWRHVETLTSPAPERGGGFGRVALDGNVLAVGAAGEEAGGVGEGRVHVFETEADNRTAWTHRAAFRSRAPIARLGQSVAVDGDTVLAGAPRHGGRLRGIGQFDISTNRSLGAAYWYHRTAEGGWEKVTHQLAPVPNPREHLGNRFGTDVALVPGTAAVGASGAYDNASRPQRLSLGEEDPPGTPTGRVTVFGPDPDRDHLATSREAEAGTPPRRADPDDDGLPDGFEVVRWGVDPFDPDTDGDGLEDGFETGSPVRGPHTQPFDADTDGDGFSDAVEVHGKTVEGRRVLGPGDPLDHWVVPSPLGPQRIGAPLLQDPYRDRTSAPPADQPHHWPGFLQARADETAAEVPR